MIYNRKEELRAYMKDNGLYETEEFEKHVELQSNTFEDILLNGHEDTDRKKLLHTFKGFAEMELGKMLTVKNTLTTEDLYLQYVIVVSLTRLSKKHLGI